MSRPARYNLITTCLDYAWPMDRDVAATPWADIQDNPSDYYDTDQFTLPARLQSPEHLSLTNVLMITQYLATHSFVFCSKADILKKRYSHGEVELLR